jgi:hypothetical protein
MPIFRCTKCGYLTEVAAGSAGTSMPCPSCATAAPVYETTFFVTKVLEKYFALRAEVLALRASSEAGSGSPQVAAQADSAAAQWDLHNTAHLATAQQHAPIVEWFKRRNVVAQVNMRAVDTTGYFDELAAAIGANHAELREVVDRIRHAQLKGYASTIVHLDRKSPEQAQVISQFCRRLYECSFVSKCFQMRQENQIRLVLQTAPAIREFFDGRWLEWQVLMSALAALEAGNRQYSCARGVSLVFQNEDANELDVFLLVAGERPICIECKSGEYRQDIDRCLALRKRLGLDPARFIVCVAGMAEEHTKGLSSTYDLTFVSERGLSAHLAAVI